MNFLRPFLLLNILCMFTESSLFPADFYALEKLGAAAAARAITEAPLPAQVILEPRIETDANGKFVFICANCNKSCICKSAFDVHLKVHTGERPHLCKKCNPPRGFSRKFHLTVHDKVHTGEKPFTCGCGKTFSQLSNLRTHTRTHTGERPFPCGCAKRFSTKHGLQSHRKICSVPLPIEEDCEEETLPQLILHPQIVSLAAQGPASLPAQASMPPSSEVFDRPTYHPIAPISHSSLHHPYSYPPAYHSNPYQNPYTSTPGPIPTFSHPIPPYPFYYQHHNGNH